MPYANAHRQAGCPCDVCERKREYQRVARGGRRVEPYHTGERLSDAERQRKYRAKVAAQRAAISQQRVDFQPTAPVRTYGTSRTGFDYDAAIQAAAYYSVPPSGLPRNGGDAR